MRTSAIRDLEAQNENAGLIVAGYVCCFMSLFFLPPGFGLAALIIGIVTIAKGRMGHGLSLVVFAVTCGLIGMFFGASVSSKEWATLVGGRPGPPLQTLGGLSSEGRNKSKQPTYSITHGDTTYYGTVSSNVGVAVLAAKSGPYLFGPGYGLSGAIRADGKFIEVLVSISNYQNSAITMDTGLFEIVDSKGNVYSASEESMDVDSASNLFLAQLNPGITKTGTIIFDVPANLAIDNLTLRFRGGMTGYSADLALKANSTVNQMTAPPESTTPPGENAVPPDEPAPGLPQDATSESGGSRADKGPQADTYTESIADPAYKTYTNARYGFAINYPDSFNFRQLPVNGDGIQLASLDGRAILSVSGGNNSGRTLKEYYDASVNDVHGALGYRVMGGDWFVVTWTDGTNLGYRKTFVGTGSQDSFTFIYPADQKAAYEEVVARIEKSFKPGDIDRSQ